MENTYKGRKVKTSQGVGIVTGIKRTGLGQTTYTVEFKTIGALTGAGISYTEDWCEDAIRVALIPCNAV